MSRAVVIVSLILISNVYGSPIGSTSNTENMAASDVPPALEEPLENSLGSGGASGLSESSTKVKSSTSCTYKPGSNQYQTASKISQFLKLSSIYQPLIQASQEIFGKEVNIHSKGSTDNDIPTSISPHMILSCSDSIQALTNAVSLMECYFDVLTDVLGNLTYDVVHNKTSIWSHVRQLVYKAYNSSSVMQDMRRLASTFPCTKVADSITCSNSRATPNINCKSNPYCNTNHIDHAAAVMPIASHVSNIDAAVPVFVQYCLTGPKKS